MMLIPLLLTALVINAKIDIMQRHRHRKIQGYSWQLDNQAGYGTRNTCDGMDVLGDDISYLIQCVDFDYRNHIIWTCDCIDRLGTLETAQSGNNFPGPSDHALNQDVCLCHVNPPPEINKCSQTQASPG
jgi:hypothetical protein